MASSSTPHLAEKVADVNLAKRAAEETTYAMSVLEQIKIFQEITKNSPLSLDGETREVVDKATDAMIGIVQGLRALDTIATGVASYGAQRDKTLDKETVDTNASNLLELCGNWRTIAMDTMVHQRTIGTLLMSQKPANREELEIATGALAAAINNVHNLEEFWMKKAKEQRAAALSTAPPTAP